MAYTIDDLENSRMTGFRPRNLFGNLLKQFFDINEGMKILDLGCGTGFFTRIIKEQADVCIVGMDINEELLCGAKRIAKEQGLDIEFKVGDITNIDYPDGTFDIVMCDIMLECFRERIDIPIREMKRVCRPGGLVAAIEPFYQSSVMYDPYVSIELRDLILKFSRADRAFGVGPMLPALFQRAGLDNIDMISWFWGGINCQTLEFVSPQDKIKSMGENLEIIKRVLPKSKALSDEEKEKILKYYEERYKCFIKAPEKLKSDMGISGLPVFIAKGMKI
ncbi:MAG: class I SAM-dependent methyltransferase [Clostridiaceae bacterium]